MRPVDAGFVLVHSPLVGPLTWAPVAAALTAAVVPSLLGVTDAPPPFWPAIARRVAEAADGLPDGVPVVIAAHSNAGYFVPVIVEAVRRRRPVAGCVFVDGALPARTGPTPIVAPILPAATGGRLPPWTAWWPDADVARLFPDPRTRHAVEAEVPRLPLTYYRQEVPVPAGWDTVPCGYLRFSEHYAPKAQEARARGWDVEHAPGLHLHQLVDPETVAARLTAMAARWQA
ncbi:alpha/beta hydrolase [Dactylosporangium sp. NBC_01737]|uniref:alpha/beta hydrolase n=1 Tax=Dactylosporangium sp. NBC_01737 TaxID=2975959 RepID=UPI002E13FEAA|nr:alpha/beta hydrolase [Dactylosporangium sp. NBC_01737]